MILAIITDHSLSFAMFFMQHWGKVSATGQPIPDGFWSPAHPELILQIREEQDALGKDYYNRSKTISFVHVDC